MIKIERELFGRKISFETAKVAKQANGAVIVRCEDSMVLVTVCMGAEKNAGFLPLTIDYIEKSYAAGKIPGGFFKREGRLSSPEILTSRLIDRPCRPLFPKGFEREVQIIATVLSADEKANTDMLAMCGASAALTISDIPFAGPVAGVRVIRKDGKLICNPTYKETKTTELDMIVAGTKDSIMMVEGGAKQVPEAEILEALFHAHGEMQGLIEMQNELREKAGKEKIEFTPKELDQVLFDKVSEYAKPKIKEAVAVAEKKARGKALKAVKTECKEEFIKEGDENAESVEEVVSAAFEKTQYDVVRNIAFEDKKRIDGRDFTTVRPIDIETTYVPRAHGSALFTRGETQAIVTATLGLDTDAKYLDPLIGDEDKKYFMLHYNFPPFCVGEARMMRGTSRREIGHGTLAERALASVLPSRKEHPYVYRVVSEITESNGSSSMASVCGGSLALMDAGVPISAPVAGVAMGLLNKDDQFVILTDILGDEDHLGDMDFKVCGTEAGITALQMDIKVKGLSQKVMTDALAQAKDARLHILSKMNDCLKESRSEFSLHAPKIVTLKINPDKIRDIIGPGGKMIRSITEGYNVKMDVEQDGNVRIAGSDPDSLKAALKLVESLTAEAEVGQVYTGVVKRIADFGAFVEVLPGVDGLCHISELSEERVRDVRDVVSEGEELIVKVIEKQDNGKIRLTHKGALS